MADSIEEEFNELETALSLSVGLGRKGVSKTLTVGVVEFIIQPIGSEDECDAFDYAESMLLQPEEPNYEDAQGNKIFKPQIGAAYVQRVKQKVVASSIVAINGVYIDRDAQVRDIEGRLVRAEKYLFDTVKSWERHLIDYFFVEYNKMLDKASKDLGIVLPKQVFLSAIDELYKQYIELSKDADERVSDASSGDVVDTPDPEVTLAREAEQAGLQDAEDKPLEEEPKESVIDQ